MNNTLAYNVWLTKHNLLTKSPHFPRRSRSFSLSDEAYEGLIKLSEIFTSDVDITHTSVTKMLEAIGLNQLTVNKPINLESEGLTIEECYEAGCEDAKEKRPQNFNLIFGVMPREFQEAYRRGYLEYKNE